MSVRCRSGECADVGQANVASGSTWTRATKQAPSDVFFLKNGLSGTNINGVSSGHKGGLSPDRMVDMFVPDKPFSGQKTSEGTTLVGRVHVDSEATFA